MTITKHYAAGFVRLVILSVLGIGSLVWSGCTSVGDPVSFDTASRMSPAPEIVGLADATREAEHYVSAHPGAQIALGSGDSMLPLYKNNTIIVIDQAPMSALRRGMTVVFVSKDGWPVAHVLVGETENGWVTMGLNNANCDAQPMQKANYVGVVARAYQMDLNPMLALARALSTDGDTAIAMAGSPAANAVTRTP